LEYFHQFDLLSATFSASNWPLAFSNQSRSRVCSSCREKSKKSSKIYAALCPKKSKINTKVVAPEMLAFQPGPDLVAAPASAGLLQLPATELSLKKFN
jgi:hypothetical protein